MGCRCKKVEILMIIWRLVQLLVWKNLFKIEGFTRDREGIPPKQFVKLWVYCTEAVVARALLTSGLLPTLGIHHHNRYNAYCLADDIMEPYRPYVR